jgi:predicted alpha/beta superfamily hydrolase
MECVREKDTLPQKDLKLVYPYYMPKSSDFGINLNSALEINKYKGSIESHPFHSKVLNNDRGIDLYLPPGYYKNPKKSFPVIYMHDGNNLFDPKIAFAGVPWQADKTIEKLAVKGLIDEVIVVGIHNTIGRHNEYTWTPMKFRDQTEGGSGAKYADFIINELKPFIDKQYRTSKSRNDTAVMGSSLGGLISFHLGLHHPEVFSKIGIISPSFWWGNGEALRDVDKINPDLKIWMDMGAKEGQCSCCNHKKNMHITNLRLMKSALIKKGYKEGQNLGYFEDAEGMHNEYSWAKRFHQPLLFFFGKQN